jgi:D-alanyl-D-alanine carboxypeptidase
MSSSTTPTLRRSLRAAAVAALSTTLGAGLLVGTAPSASAAPAAERRQGDGIREGQLDRLLARVHRQGAVGVTAELVTPDGTWRGAAGNGERNPRLPASERAQFRAASVSKQLMTVLALQQVDRGRWTLDTTLGSVLPDLWPDQGTVTLRQLLSHTSGLPEYLTPLLGTDPSATAFTTVISRRYTDEQLVAAARTQPTTPRGQFVYANTNFVLVGMMLEEATGRSLADLLAQRVFGPARMTESAWPSGTRTTRPRLKEYGRLYGQTISLAGFQPSMFSGAGALLTTARDLDRFQLALSRGELVPRSLVRQMRSVTSDGGDLGLEYGLGSYRLPDPCKPGRWVHGHDGGSWGTITLSYASPSGDRRVAVSMTGRNYDGDNRAVATLSELAVKALAQTCGGKPKQTETTTTSGDAAPRLLAVG